MPTGTGGSPARHYVIGTADVKQHSHAKLFMLFKHEICALALAPADAGNSIAARMAMIAITTKGSTK
ncbi:MAG: hypothetical protein ACTHLW_14070 [Verrucomicrobiota bacterium]